MRTRTALLAILAIIATACSGADAATDVAESSTPPEVVTAAKQRVVDELTTVGIADAPGEFSSDVECREASVGVYSCLVQHRSSVAIDRADDGFTARVEVEHFEGSGRTVTRYLGDG